MLPCEIEMFGCIAATVFFLSSGVKVNTVDKFGKGAAVYTSRLRTQLWQTQENGVDLGPQFRGLLLSNCTGNERKVGNPGIGSKIVN